MVLPSPGHYASIIVLTGAGISAESGLRTFRDNNGLWKDYRVEDLATPEAFAKNPTLVHEFYNSRRQKLTQSAKPNLAHLALASFEREFNGDFLLVTQNVDNLHERAGSKNICHIHGELLKVRCNFCQASRVEEGAISTESTCHNCHGIGGMRPDIVWFGETPMHMEAIERALSQCDLFIAIGTSGNVYPAAGFVHRAKRAGVETTTVELNLEASAVSEHFDFNVQGTATSVVPGFFGAC